MGNWNKTLFIIKLTADFTDLQLIKPCLLRSFRDGGGRVTVIARSQLQYTNRDYSDPWTDFLSQTRRPILTNEDGYSTSFFSFFFFGLCNWNAYGQVRKPSSAQKHVLSKSPAHGSSSLGGCCQLRALIWEMREKYSASPAESSYTRAASL